MEVSCRFSFNRNVVVRWRSTLDKLRSLVQAFGFIEASISWIPALVGAREKAMPTMTELEAALKNRNKKGQIKSFKV